MSVSPFKNTNKILFLTSFRSFLLAITILLALGSTVVNGQLIPFASTQKYSFVNEIVIRQEQKPSKDNEEGHGQEIHNATDIKYRFSSQLIIKSIWNSQNNQQQYPEQLLEIYLTDNQISSQDKNGQERSQSITEIPIDRPFYVSLVDNRLDRIIAHTYRDQSLLNIKKSVASLLQIPSDVQGSTEREETDISGTCKVQYRHRLSNNNNNNNNHLEKRKSDCSNWDLRVHYRPEGPFGIDLISEQLLDYELSTTNGGRLEKVKSREWHQMQLTANKGLGQRVESFLEMQRIPTIGVDRSGRGGGNEQRNEKSLEEVVDSLMDWNRVFDVAGDVDDEINDLKQQNLTLKELIIQNLNELKDEYLGQENLAEIFVRLLPRARLTKMKEFVEILRGEFGATAAAIPSIRGQLMDLMGAVQTIESHRAVHEVLHYDRKQDQDLLEKYLQSLAMSTTHSDPLIIIDLYERLSSKSIKNWRLFDTGLQTLASLMKYYVNEKEKDENLRKIHHYLIEDVIMECKRNDNVCTLRYLRALKNLQDPSTINILLKYVNESVNLKIATTAMDAIHSYFRLKESLLNTSHREIFTAIFYQLYRRYDSSIRLMALDLLFTGKSLELHENRLKNLLRWLIRDDHHQFEMKTYVIQKLRMLAEQSKHFRTLLSNCLREMPDINNNYNVLAQKGLTTVLLRDLSWSTAFNESILSVQEISKGVLKRGSVEMLLHTNDYQDLSTFKLGMFSNGLTGFIGSSGNDDDDDDVSRRSDTSDPSSTMMDEGPVTAGMEISVHNVHLRPLTFFEGHTELMGHVWSGTASEPTPAFQATLLDHDYEHYVLLASGATVHMRLLSSKSMDLYGQVQFSLWNRNANTEIVHQCGVAIHGSMRAGITYGQVESEFVMSYEPTLSLQANVDFYSGIKMCIQLQRPDHMKRYVGRKNVLLKTMNPVQKYQRKWNFTSTMKVDGRTFALNQKNNDMCNMIFN